MEGPTPVSALIHAATMVTAGVYLIARMHPFFERAPAPQDVGAIIGAATLLVAATIALAQSDIKRVIAYSTMSQIGYMIMGVSVGAYAAGMFHLMTHAFFKALLFMGAGSIIGAMAGEQSLDRMGGFRKAMPFTYASFLIGGVARGAAGGGLLQIPQVDFVVDDFLKPSFGDSSLYATHTRNGLLVLGLVIGTVLALLGIALAYRLWVLRPGSAATIRARARPLY